MLNQNSSFKLGLKTSRTFQTQEVPMKIQGFITRKLKKLKATMESILGQKPKFIPEKGFFKRIF